MAGVTRFHLRVEGKVQGVFFRKHTNLTAQTLGVVGVVRNLSDGSVEIVAESKDVGKLEQLENWCRTKGSPKSRVSKVVCSSERRETPSYSTFSIDKSK